MNSRRALSFRPFFPFPDFAEPVDCAFPAAELVAFPVAFAAAELVVDSALALPLLLLAAAVDLVSAAELVAFPLPLLLDAAVEEAASED